MAQGRIATTILFLLLLLAPAGAEAQEERDSQEATRTMEAADPKATIVSVDSIGAVADSLMSQVRVDSLTLRLQEQFQRRSSFKPDPKRALWLALVFPGGGQIYNRKYWKLPIVYGGFLGCYYALSWNNQMLRDYSQAYLDIMDNDPNTKSYEKMLPLNYDITGRESQFKEIFKNKKNYYRKYRDMSILAFAAVYAIAVIDAYVDAELSSFDISQDLTLQWAPAVISNNPVRGSQRVGTPEPDRGFGVALRLSF
jgi:hypothetical protein